MFKTCPVCSKPFTAKTPSALKRKKTCGMVCGHALLKYDFWKAIEVMWSRIDRNGPGGCWIWQGSTNSQGYGAMWIERRPMVAIHRIMYELARGNIPEGQWCLHKCDTPLCCNPEHLYLGNAKENSDDKFRKGRAKCTGGYKLKPDDVREIRRLWNEGWTAPQLAEKFPVTALSIWRVAAGRIYKDIQ